jgi:hypothetical protein
MADITSDRPTTTTSTVVQPIATRIGNVLEWVISSDPEKDPLGVVLIKEAGGLTGDLSAATTKRADNGMKFEDAMKKEWREKLPEAIYSVLDGILELGYDLTKLIIHFAKNPPK